MEEKDSFSEMDWLGSKTPLPMVRFLRRKEVGTDRKYALFCVTCCRILYGQNQQYDLAELTDGHENEWAGGARMLAVTWCEAPADLTGSLPPCHRADLLRCIFGNPFRSWMRENAFVAGAPVRSKKINIVREAWFSWRNGLIPHMAATIYQQRDWPSLPLLADALEEAGCTEESLLGHLRGPGPHARGCWALDCILGKE